MKKITIIISLLFFCSLLFSNDNIYTGSAARGSDDAFKIPDNKEGYYGISLIVPAGNSLRVRNLKNNLTAEILIVEGTGKPGIQLLLNSAAADALDIHPGELSQVTSVELVDKANPFITYSEDPEAFKEDLEEEFINKENRDPDYGSSVNIEEEMGKLGYEPSEPEIIIETPPVAPEENDSDFEDIIIAHVRDDIDGTLVIENKETLAVNENLEEKEALEPEVVEPEVVEPEVVEPEVVEPEVVEPEVVEPEVVEPEAVEPEVVEPEVVEPEVVEPEVVEPEVVEPEVVEPEVVEPEVVEPEVVEPEVVEPEVVVTELEETPNPEPFLSDSINITEETSVPSEKKPGSVIYFLTQAEPRPPQVSIDETVVIDNGNTLTVESTVPDNGAILIDELPSNDTKKLDPDEELSNMPGIEDRTFDNGQTLFAPQYVEPEEFHSFINGFENSGSRFIQIFHFNDNNKEALMKNMEKLYKSFPYLPITVDNEKNVLLAGPVSRDEVGILLYAIKAYGFKDAIVKRVGE